MNTMKINYILINNIEEKIDAYINFNKKILNITSKLYAFKIYINLMNGKELILKSDSGILITLYGINLLSDKKNYKFTFKNALIGINGYNNLTNISYCKIKIKYLSNNKIFNNPNNNKKIIIPGNYTIKITNNHIFFSNCNLSFEIISQVLFNVINLIYFITGKTIIVQEILYNQNDNFIKEIRDEPNFYKIDIQNDQALVNISEIKDFSKVYNDYIYLTKKVKKLPIQAFFIAKDNINIIELKLVTILQGLDGLCQNLYNKCIALKYPKDIFNKKKKEIKKALTTLVNYDLLNDICNKIGGINGIEFKDYINYIINDTFFGKIIFYDEINKVNDCTKFYCIDDFKRKTINERNRFSHMNNDSNKDYLNNEEYIYFYLKYKLTYRCCILSSINIEIDNTLLFNNTYRIKNILPNISNICLKCKIENQ